MNNLNNKEIEIFYKFDLSEIKKILNSLILYLYK